MAPVIGSTEPESSSSFRSNTRRHFCEQVAQRAAVVAENLVQSEHWINIFTDIHDSKARQKLSDKEGSMSDLFATLDVLIEKLHKLARANTRQPLMVFALDEVSNLFAANNNNNTNEGIYVALNRIISCLKEYPVWFFFLSTNSRIEDLFPSDEMRFKGNSGHRASAGKSFHQPSPESESEPPLKRIPPFVALQLDIEDRRVMRENPNLELQKPIRDFADARHMAQFGRPLWNAYADNPEELYKIARRKLIGENKRYDPANPNHVVAALSFRLSLDVCLQGTVGIPLSRVAVNSFLRVAILLDQDSGILKTITPSEPLLAKAAMELVCKGNHWPRSIQTLTGDLLEKGSVEKGLKGELFTRLLLTLAHERVRFYVSPSQYVSTYRVGDFLHALYGAQYENQLETIDRAIRDARMNFNHFVAAEQCLEKPHIHALLRDLLRRQGALQLFSQQPQFDLLIPIHADEQHHENGKVSCIAIQVKNRVKRSSPGRIFGLTFVDPSSSSSRGTRKRGKTAGPKAKNHILSGITQPTLLLLFDLDAPAGNKKLVDVTVEAPDSSNTDHRMWLIDSRGHNEDTFDCLKAMGCEKAVKPLFATVTAEPSLHDKLAQRNAVFHRLEESYRYQPSLLEGKNPDTITEPQESGVEQHDGSDDDAEQLQSGMQHSSSVEAAPVLPSSSKRTKAGGRGDRKRARGE